MICKIFDEGERKAEGGGGGKGEEGEQKGGGEKDWMRG